MKAAVKDLDILKAIQSQQVATYLHNKGWYEQRQIADRASIWTQKTDSGEEFQIVLPLNSDIPGFPVSMNIMLETLEIAERRSQLEILDELISCVPNVQVQGIVTDLKNGSQRGQVTLMGCAVGQFRKIYLELTKTHIPPLKCHIQIIFALNKPETYAKHKFQAFIAKTVTPEGHSQQLTFVENSLAQN